LIDKILGGMKPSDIFNGTAISTIESGGGQDVQSGGLASLTIVSSGGRDVIDSGGTAIGATIYGNDTGDDTEGGYQVGVSGGTASGTVITSSAI
jgi:autotransporter passenger strand-loop-strand repeat protein